MSTDPLFMRNSSGEYFWYHNDHLGTPQMMTTSSGAVVWKAKYTSFGKATVDSASTVVNPLRFPGQYEDAETGLHYNWWRYYNPAKGRYLRHDPIGFWGGINFFEYAFSNPNNNIDPEGRIALPILVYVVMPIAITISAIWAIERNKKILKNHSENDDENWRKRHEDWEFIEDLYDPIPPDPEEEKRRQTEEECYKECESEMTGDCFSQGIPFTNCMKTCMGKYGYTYP